MVFIWPNVRPHQFSLSWPLEPATVDLDVGYYDWSFVIFNSASWQILGYYALRQYYVI